MKFVFFNKIYNSALFLDRDGVINKDLGYVHTKDKFILCQGIVEVIRYCNSIEIPVFIITNQAGIAKGFYTLEEYLYFSNWIEEFLKKLECRIKKTYFCPFHPNGIIKKNTKASECRKPNPGMLLKAEKDWNISLKNSIIIGDKITDIIAGHNAGLGAKFLVKKYPKKEFEDISYIDISNVGDFLNYV